MGTVDLSVPTRALARRSFNQHVGLVWKQTTNNQALQPAA